MDAYTIFKAAMRLSAFWGIAIVGVAVEHSWGDGMIIGGLLMGLGIWGWE